MIPLLLEKDLLKREATDMKQQTNKFELLRDKEIISILDGDKQFGTLEIDGKDSGIKIEMPYLSGPTLCEISKRFGLPASYLRNGSAQSRWVYFDELMDYCIQNNRISDLLSFLFSKEQFMNTLKGRSPAHIEYAHTQIVKTVIEHINSILYFGGNELVLIGKKFLIREIGTNISVEVPAVERITREYIIDLSNRAMKNVADRNYDSAITQSRTLLEEVFCYVIEKKGETPSESGDIKKLYSQVKQLHNMHQNKEIDKRINTLLSGLEKILTSIAEMRNIGSDSHGVGSRRINIEEHHARLLVNSAMTMADFILAVSEKQQSIS